MRLCNYVLVCVVFLLFAEACTPLPNTVRSKNYHYRDKRNNVIKYSETNVVNKSTSSGGSVTIIGQNNIFETHILNALILGGGFNGNLVIIADSVHRITRIDGGVIGGGASFGRNSTDTIRYKSDTKKEINIKDIPYRQKSSKERKKEEKAKSKEEKKKEEAQKREEKPKAKKDTLSKVKTDKLNKNPDNTFSHKQKNKQNPIDSTYNKRNDIGITLEKAKPQTNTTDSILKNEKNVNKELERLAQSGGKETNVFLDYFQETVTLEYALRYFTGKIKEGKKEYYYEIAQLYFYGIGLPLSAAKALSLYEQSAIMGHLESIKKAGDIYWNGALDVKIDKKKAIYFYTLGSQLNDYHCQEMLKKAKN